MNLKMLLNDHNKIVRVCISIYFIALNIDPYPWHIDLCDCENCRYALHQNALKNVCSSVQLSLSFYKITPSKSAPFQR